MTGSVHVEVDGRPATTDDLRHRALANYGHFTAMQIRDGGVRGLALHLARLRAATHELFGADLDGDHVRKLVRHALGRRTTASVRIDVHRPAPAPADVSIMVTVRPPVEMPDAPQRLRTVRYERPVAHVKHVGTFAQIYFGERAERDGFDDALLVGADDRVLEATIANIGFIDAHSVIWPEGPTLRGITWQLLDRELPPMGMATGRRTIRLGQISDFAAAFVTHSVGVAPVGWIDDAELPVDHDAVALIRRTYEAVPWDPI